MCRMLDSHAGPEVQVHGFAQYGECSADKCLTRNDSRTRGHDDGEEQHTLRHDGKERIHGNCCRHMVQHPCSLSQIVENEHGLYKGPADGDILPAAMSQVGVESLCASSTEEYGAQDQEPFRRLCQQNNSVIGIESLHYHGVRRDADGSHHAKQQKPYQHEDTERLANALCAKPLHEEDDGDDGKCDGNDRQFRTDAHESFDGCGNRDSRGDDSVCQQSACANDSQYVNPLTLESAQKSVESENASFTIVVGSQGHAYIFDGGL